MRHRTRPRWLCASLLAVLFVAWIGCQTRPGEEVESVKREQQQRHADLVVVNAKVWTGDNPQPPVTALAVAGGRFVYVGEEAAVRQWVGPGSKVVDAGGRRILPGLIDAHVHLISGGLQLARLNLRDVVDRQHFITAVAERARNTPPKAWILGGRWSTESWADAEEPRKEWIDPVTGGRPALLVRMDGHSAVVNSVALRMAGITADGPADPAGGTIDRDPATNEPTGFLREAAVDLVKKLVPRESPSEQAEALAAAMREAHRYGVTTVHTMSAWSEIEPIRRARAEGRLSLRVRFYISEDDWTRCLDEARLFPGDERLAVAGFKQFMDGSLGSRTAYMAEPYSDNAPAAEASPTTASQTTKPGNTAGVRPDAPVATRSRRGTTGGTPVPQDLSDRTATSPTGGAYESTAVVRRAARSAGWRGLLTATAQREGEMLGLCQAADGAGLGLAIHAIGDQANHLLLDMYEQEAVANGPRASPRLRIEHAQHLLPGDIGRFALLGVVASMQPLHKVDDARYAEQAIGTERCRTSYAFRSLLDAGARVAFGSDWPVVSISPFEGMQAAVTGRTAAGQLFVPEQNITIEQALRCYTIGGAFAAGEEDRLGRIAPGYLADFVILDQDVMTIAPDDIAHVTVRETYVGGVRVWPAD